MQKENAKSALRSLKELESRIGNRANGREHIEHACRLGGPSLVIVTLKKWQEEEEVQVVGCFCLALMVRFGPDPGPAFEAGGIEAALTAMTNFPDSERVNRAGCRMLVVSFCGRLPLKKAWWFVNDGNGIAWLTKVMKKFPRNADIQECCCNLFFKFSGPLWSPIKDIKDIMIKEGVVGAVSSALERHPRSDGIRKAASDFMQRKQGLRPWKRVHERKYSTVLNHMCWKKII